MVNKNFQKLTKLKRDAFMHDNVAISRVIDRSYLRLQ